jgi:hypothetical protein
VANAVSYVGAWVTSGNGDSVETNVTMPVKGPGTISNLRVDVNGAPGAGKSWTFTVRKNATTDTAVTCTITGGTATACSDSSNTASFSAGDTIDLKVTPSGGPAAKPMGWAVAFG